jgi:proteasome lid subunit RPN8/RPN11
LVSLALAQDLAAVRPLSHRVEEGGFLIGRVFLDADCDGGYIVEITEALTAQFTGASLLHFTFTGDSFAEIKQSLRTRDQGERIVGWYHTHLFPATDAMGLSSIDLTLHFNTFRVPWQLAGLVNLDFEKSSRVLRFYIRDGNQMIQCPHWTLEDHTAENEDVTRGDAGETHVHPKTRPVKGDEP